MRSLRLADPVLICPPPIATIKSARNVSSVSPDRWETTVFQPAFPSHSDAVAVCAYVLHGRAIR